VKRYPRVAINRRFPLNDALVPANLEVEIDGKWISLGTMGSANYGGPGSEEKAAHYRAVVARFVTLYLAAPALFAHLEAVVRWLRTQPFPSNDQDLRDSAARLLVGTEAIIKQAKEEL
jgi:hypothetical protein